MRFITALVCSFLLVGTAFAQSVNISILPSDRQPVSKEKAPSACRDLNLIFADIDSKISKGVVHVPSHTDTEFVDVLNAGGCVLTENDRYTMKCLALGMQRDSLDKAFEALKLSILDIRGQNFSSVMRVFGATQIDFRLGMFASKYNDARTASGTKIVREDIPSELHDEINSAMIHYANKLSDSANQATQSVTRAQVINDYVLDYNRKNPKNIITAIDLSEEMKTKIVNAAEQQKEKPAFVPKAPVPPATQ